MLTSWPEAKLHGEFSMPWKLAAKADLTRPEVVVLSLSSEGRIRSCHVPTSVVAAFARAAGIPAKVENAPRDRDEWFGEVRMAILTAAQDKLAYSLATDSGAFQLEEEDIGRPTVDLAAAANPAALHQRATEARAIARSISDPTAKKAAVAIARNYDDLALFIRGGEK